MSKIETIQKAIDYLSDDITWNNYPNDPSLGWYYVEGEQYVIRDAMLDTFFFVRARSPKEAYEKFVKRLNEAFNAREWMDEDETF